MVLFSVTSADFNGDSKADTSRLIMAGLIVMHLQDSAATTHPAASPCVWAMAMVLLGRRRTSAAGAAARLRS